MANLAKWNTTSTSPAITVMSTTLAALASSSLSVASSQTVVNSSGLRIYSDWELNVGTTAGAFGTGAYAAVYIVPAMDGTNFAELNTAGLQSLAIFALTTSTANVQHRMYRQLISIPPVDFTVAVFNGSTQTWSTGSGDNVLKASFYDVNLNG